MLGNGLLVIGILLVLFGENLYVGAGLALYTAVTLLALKAIQPLAVSRWTAERATSAELYGFIEERISGAEEIRAAGAEAYTMRRLYGLLRRAMETFRASIMVDTLVFNVTSLLTVVGYAVGLALGVYLYTRGQATIGTAYMIVAYVGMLAQPLQKIRAELQDLQHATASIGRVNELLRMQPHTGDSMVGAQSQHTLLALPAGPLAVGFENVSFAYNDEARKTEDEGDAGLLAGSPTVLQSVTFRLQPGRVLGVLGRTGSGKSDDGAAVAPPLRYRYRHCRVGRDRHPRRAHR